MKTFNVFNIRNLKDIICTFDIFISVFSRESSCFPASTFRSILSVCSFKPLHSFDEAYELLSISGTVYLFR